MIETVTQEKLDLLFEDPTDLKMSSKEYKELEELYNSYEMISPKKGDVVNGTYKGISSDQHVFSVGGYKDDVRIENKSGENKHIDNLEIEDNIDFIIIDVDTMNFFIKGSIAQLFEGRAHLNIKNLEKNQSVTAYIKDINPAGYSVQILEGGVVLDAFMPNTLAGINKLVDPKSIIGDEFEVTVESYSEHEGTYIVSRKKYLQTLIPEVVETLDYDEVYTGHVTGTAPFGVFVEFNKCLTGMIHKDNLNEDWQNRISDIKPGFEVDFYIKEVIKEKGKRFKIILTQMVTEDIWSTIEPGQVLTGSVKAIKEFGALISLDSETVGLVHSSEMAKFTQEFKEGKDLDVKVLHVDRSSRKIFLISPN